MCKKRCWYDFKNKSNGVTGSKPTSKGSFASDRASHLFHAECDAAIKKMLELDPTATLFFSRKAISTLFTLIGMLHFFICCRSFFVELIV